MGTNLDVLPDKLVAAKQVRQFAGGISNMTLFRWLDDPAKGFPRPVIISGRRYWWWSHLREWGAAQMQKNPADTAAPDPNSDETIRRADPREWAEERSRRNRGDQ